MRRIRPEDLPEPRARSVLARFCIEARRHPEVKQVIVYGSMARGDADEESDLDLWVDWDGDEAAGREVLSTLAGHLFVDTGVLVSVHVVAPERRRRLEEWQTGFFQSVEAEGLVVEA